MIRARDTFPLRWIPRFLLFLAVTRAVSGWSSTNSDAWNMGLLGHAPQWRYLEEPKANGVKAISYTGMSYKGEPVRVFAWLGVPKVHHGQKVPAMVLVHGGGGTAFADWVRLWVSRGYAAIAMDTCGQIPLGNYANWLRDQQGGPPGWGGFDQVDLPREDQWTFHAVADVILAHSLIRSLPEVDPDRIGITGISWGGYLTCIVAGVDHRFKLAVPVYGCGYYHDTLFEKDLVQMGPEKAARWFNWWDPSGFLGNADLPTLWVTGSNDFAYPLAAVQKSYRQAKGPHHLCVRLRMVHSHGGPGESPEEIHIFANQILKGGDPLMDITATGRKGSAVWATVNSKLPLIKAQLNYTRDTGPWQDRKWDSASATLSGDRVTATLPEGTRVYFLNVTDRRNCIVSTEHEVLDPSLNGSSR